MKRMLVPTIVVLTGGLIFTQERPKPEQIYRNPKLEVMVADFPAEGLILDIGGGGEGVIGRLKGRQVVAIDLIKRELEEAPGEPLLKIVMDARDLKFLDGSFATATAFFTFMYIAPEDHERVVAQIRRVLRPGGKFLLWDAVFPPKKDPGHLYVLFPLHVRLPQAEIATGYGVPFREGQGADHFIGIAEKAGLRTVAREGENGWFLLRFEKPL